MFTLPFIRLWVSWLVRANFADAAPTTVISIEAFIIDLFFFLLLWGPVLWLWHFKPTLAINFFFKSGLSVKLHGRQIGDVAEYNVFAYFFHYLGKNDNRKISSSLPKKMLARSDVM